MTIHSRADIQSPKRTQQVAAITRWRITMTSMPKQNAVTNRDM